jgi:hypothetical protein
LEKIFGVIPPDLQREERDKKGRIGEGKGWKGEEREEGRGGEEGRGYSPSKNVCLSSPLPRTPVRKERGGKEREGRVEPLQYFSQVGVYGSW